MGAERYCRDTTLCDLEEDCAVKKSKKQKLERAGWVVSGTQEFLDLSDAAMALIDVRVSLAQALRQRRQKMKISQATFAKRVGSSQSRVAKMEAGDPSVSIDLLVRSLITSGSSAEEIGKVIASAGLDPATV
jgi:DNA-binding XRE family transcriptional regulator